MKKHNPHTPILIREAAGTLPRVYARYGMPQLIHGSGVFLTGAGQILVERSRKCCWVSWPGIEQLGMPLIHLAGLSDQQIEEKLTGLVKESS